MLAVKLALAPLNDMVNDMVVRNDHDFSEKLTILLYTCYWTLLVDIQG